MFRTEVVKTRNLRKTVFFKIYNAIAILLFLFVLSVILHLFGKDSAIEIYIQENYTSVFQPAVMAVALAIFAFSIYTKNAAKNPKRLGSVEIDENEIRYLIEDELHETLSFSEVKSIEFEFFSFRMRGNPMGSMNYLTFHTNSGDKAYEIVIANSLVKAEFGELLSNLNKNIPVTVKFAYFLKRIIGDNDFKF